MSFVQVEDSFYWHPKILAAGKDARDLYLGAIMYSRRSLTDGYIPVEALAHLDPTITDPGHASKLAGKLVLCGLFRRPRGKKRGFIVHDYAKHQQTKGDVEAARAKAKERKRRQRERDNVTEASQRDGRGGVTPTEQNRAEGEIGNNSMSREDQPVAALQILPTSVGDAVFELLQVLGDADDGTLRVLRSFNLPPMAFRTVRETVLERNPKRPAAYAVSELKRMVTDGQYAA